MQKKFSRFVSQFVTNTRRMKLLKRTEEFVMLAIWKLQEDGYTLAIREKVSEITEHDWSLSSIYTPLERLERRGLITSHLTDPTARRGGRHKRVYQLTPAGRRDLLHIRRIEEAMWANVTGLAVSIG